MANINLATKDDLVKILTEQEAEELVQLITEKRGRLTKDEFLKQTNLSKTKAIGITKQFEFYEIQIPEIKQEQIEQAEIVSDQSDVVTSEQMKEKEEGAVAKDVRYEKMLEKMRLAMTEYFFEELQKVEKTCTDNHVKQNSNFEKQAASIKKVEHELENVNSAVKALEKSSTEVVKACTQQAVKEMEIKKEEYTHALETLQLGIRTDVNILRKEQREWTQNIKTNVTDRDQVTQLQSQMNELSGTVNEVTVKVIELQNESKTFEYIDKAHTDHQIGRLDAVLQQVQHDQEVFKDDLNKIRNTVNQSDEKEQRYPRENEMTNRNGYEIDRKCTTQ